MDSNIMPNFKKGQISVLLTLSFLACTCFSEATNAVESFSLDLHGVYKYSGLPPNDRQQKKIWSIPDRLGDGDLWGISNHPSGDIEFLTYLIDGSNVELIRLNQNGSLEKRIVVSSKKRGEMYRWGPHIILASSSFDGKFLALIESEESDSTSSDTLRIVNLKNEVIDARQQTFRFPVEANFRWYERQSFAWSKNTNSIFYTGPTNKVHRFDVESGSDEMLVEGFFAGVIPNSNKILFLRKQDQYHVLDLATNASEQIKIPQKLTNRNIDRIVPMPGGVEVLLQTPRFMPFMDDAIYYWQARIDGSEMKKVGPSRSSYGPIVFPR